MFGLLKHSNNKQTNNIGETQMKVQASVKRVYGQSRVIRRRGFVQVICEIPQHKQRQG